MIKDVLVKLGILTLSVTLVACASNTREENTAIGAVTGAVVGGVAGSAIGAGTGQAVAIGAGIVAGALIGGAVGNSMESTDHVEVYHTMDSYQPHHARTWVNHHNGMSYRVVPTSGVMAYHGYKHCRKFHATSIMNGRKERVHGVVCRQRDGSWRTV